MTRSTSTGLRDSAQPARSAGPTSTGAGRIRISSPPAGVQDFDPLSASSGGDRRQFDSDLLGKLRQWAGREGQYRWQLPDRIARRFRARALCGLVADQNFVYWLDTGLAQSIGRATVNGTDRQGNFVTGAASSGACGLAADPNFLYFGAGGKAVGRAPIGGGAATPTFIASAVPAREQSAASPSTPNTSSGATPVQVTSSAARIWAVAPRIRA